MPVAHVEAGLRSFDRTMPEEINRVVTDALADLLLHASRATRDDEPARERASTPTRIHLVGNVMIDTLLAHSPRLATAAARRSASASAPRRYARR